MTSTQFQPTRRPVQIAFAALAFATSVALFAGLSAVAPTSANPPAQLTAATQPTGSPVLRTAVEAAVTDAATAVVTNTAQVLVGMATQNVSTLVL
jgi:hypothetical protein